MDPTLVKVLAYILWFVAGMLFGAGLGLLSIHLARIL
jgi:hypothetical protein